MNKLFFGILLGLSITMSGCFGLEQVLVRGVAGMSGMYMPPSDPRPEQIPSKYFPN